jgi:receptor-type tyrosine-protein phosphatase N
MSGATYKLDGQYADPLIQILKFTKKIPISYLKVYLTVFLLTTTFSNLATAEHLIGCLLTDDVCEQDETCFDDFAFGRCLSPSDFQNDDFIYQYPTYSPRAETLLEEEMSRLYYNGYTWKDEYTQCIMQTALAAIKYEIEFDSGLCNAINEDIQDENDNIETINGIPERENYLNTLDTNHEDLEQPAVYYVDIDPEQDQDTDDDDTNTNEEFNTTDSNNSNYIYFYTTSKKDNYDSDIPEDEEILDISTRDLEQPIELTGIEDLPIQRTKFNLPPLISEDSDSVELYQRPDDAIDYEIIPEYPDDEEYDTDPTSDLIEYSIPDNINENTMIGQDESPTDSSPHLEPYSMLFNRKERMDVKKPGPFFEASPNNFYLDKIVSEEENEGSENNNNDENNTENEVEKVDKNATNKDNNDLGQQEYEIPMSTSMEKRADTDTVEDYVPNDDELNNYVHIALDKKLKHWKDGEDVIETLSQELGIPEQAIQDEFIENQHIQFKVEPNARDIDASQVAQALENDINVQKRLSNDLGVEISKAAAGKRVDRASVFPHGRNLNLLILTVVGASATASLLVGGLIFILAKRSRSAKKINKLQLSDDDAEDRVKVQEEYKQLCRDWSKTSQPTSMESAKNKPVTTSVSKLQESNGNTANGSNRSSRSSTSSWTDEPASNSMDISTGHMVLAYMEDHLKNKQRLEQEWVGLCGYEAEPNSTAVAFKAENKKKNRYPDKLPYDHNRVILNALVNATNSDYINASTVTDHDPRNPSYIVTQGPLGQTVSDFWQMVWEQGCVVIVMLSRLQDNGYQLCTRYWPEEGSEQYHIFEVHLVSEHIWCDDYLVRSFYLKNTRTGETRTVTQFHFQSWPAHGVPASTKALLEFRRKVNKSYRGRACPIVIHCSDGVGRSGTYVLIDMVLNRLSKGCKEIDIAATLEHIRDQRGGMVQNRQQFEYCLMAVAEEVHAILKALPQ